MINDEKNNELAEEKDVDSSLLKNEETETDTEKSTNADTNSENTPLVDNAVKIPIYKKRLFIVACIVVILLMTGLIAFLILSNMKYASQWNPDTNKTITAGRVTLTIPDTWKYDKELSTNTLFYYDRHDKKGNVIERLLISDTSMGDDGEYSGDSDYEYSMLSSFNDGLGDSKDFINIKTRECIIKKCCARKGTAEMKVGKDKWPTKVYFIYFNPKELTGVETIKDSEILSILYIAPKIKSDDYKNVMKTLKFHYSAEELSAIAKHKEEVAQKKAEAEQKEREEAEKEEAFENEIVNATMGETNALQSAESYLATQAFSKQGLIEQLEYEGYTNEEATFAADHCEADWEAQAVACAKEYLDAMAFSKQGLIEQLEYDGFTSEEANHGADAAYQ